MSKLSPHPKTLIVAQGKDDRVCHVSSDNEGVHAESPGLPEVRELVSSPVQKKEHEEVEEKLGSSRSGGSMRELPKNRFRPTEIRIAPPTKFELVVEEQKKQEQRDLGAADAMAELAEGDAADAMERQRAADNSRRELYCNPWLARGTAHSLNTDGGYYTYIDGPEKQVYSLPPVPQGWVTILEPRHTMTVRMLYRDGQRIPVGVEGVRDQPLPPDWSGRESSEHQEALRQAVLSTVPMAIGVKFDISTNAIVSSAEVELSKRVKPWPSAKAALTELVQSDWYMEAVISYHAERRRKAPSMVRAKINMFGAQLLATEDEIEEALRRIFNNETELMRWNRHVREKYLVHCVLALFIAVIVPKELTVVCAMVGLVAWKLATLWTRSKFRESVVERLVNSFNTGPARAKFASVLSVEPTCSGPLRAEIGLKDEGGFKHKVKFSPVTTPCKSLKKYEPYGCLIAGAPLVVPAGCHHDINNAAVIRFLFPREQRTDMVGAVIGHAMEWMGPLFAKHSSQWWYVGREEWLGHLRGGRKTMLINEPEAVDLWAQNPIDAFVKKEAYLGKNPGNFKPRLIMGRKLGYQNVVGHYMYSVSKFVARVLNTASGKWYVSGASPLEVGDFAHGLFSKKKYVVESDVSNWDGSLHPMWRKFEVWFIENCVPAECPRWAEIKRMWGKTVVQGPKGFRMQTNFCRHSGDMWTSFMNSLINIAIVSFIDPDSVIAALGDDNFWGTDRTLDELRVREIYGGLGMKVDINVRESIDDLEFCSGRFYSTDKGKAWGVKPFRVFSKFGMNLNRHKGRERCRRMLYGTALSMLPVGNHVPLLGEFLRGVVISGVKSNLIPDFSESWNQEWRIVGGENLLPSSDAYTNFSDRYQLSHSEASDLFDCVSLMTNLGLDCFPVSLEGPLWLRGFGVDSGVAVGAIASSSVATIGIHVPKVPFPWVPLVVAPLLEELIKVVWLPSAILMGAWEGGLERTFLHLMLGVVSNYNYFVGAFLHFLYNYGVWRNSVDYRIDDMSGSVLGYCSLLTRGDLFRSIADCSPLHNTKDNSSPVWSLLMLEGSSKISQLKNKNQQKGKKSSQKTKNTKKGKGSLGRSLLSGGLGALGSLLGPAGATVGASLGDWGANILGMGDYTVEKNSLNMGAGVPHMHAGYKSMRITHREFLTDVTGSVSFTPNKYVINPGSQSTFPWLSGIADQFQSYKIHGLAFEFVSTSADALNSVNTALGSVIMATQYNVALPDFTSKAQMAQYEFSCTTRPSRSLMHMVECDPKLQVMEHLFTRVGNLPAGADYQFYDWGNFYLATVGMQAAATIGELWVTYDIEFYKPRIDGSGSYPGDFTRISNGPFSAANPLGDVQTAPIGSLGVTVVSSGAGFGRIFFPPSLAAGRYLVQVVWKYAAAGGFVLAAGGSSNVTGVNTWELGTSTFGSTVGPTRASVWAMITINGYSANGSYVDYPLAGSATTPQFVDVLVVALPRTDVAF